MRTKLLNLAGIVLVAFTLSSCSKSSTTSPSTTTTTTTTPPAATFSATVNGKVTTFTGTANYNASFPLITFMGNETPYIIQIIDLTLTQGTATTLGSYSSFQSYATITDGTNTWSTDGTHTGTITLTTYNASGKTASGTFSFTGYSSTAGTISVTAGSFANVTWN